MDEKDKIINELRHENNVLKMQVKNLEAKLYDKLKPKGKWIDLRNNTYQCSRCEEIFDDKYPFCPSCGTKMLKNFVENFDNE